jgi:hypothetical protein
MNTFWVKWVLALGVMLVLGALLMAFFPAPATAPGGGSVSAALGQKILTGGVYITPLELVEDSRCPADVQCIQAGTVRIRATINSLNGDFVFKLGEPQTVGEDIITLAAVTPALKYSTVTVQPPDYLFIFAVQKAAPVTDGGTLSGTMTIGPICPVERPGQPCKPSPETYAAHQVYVYSADRKNLITTLTPDAEGKFSTELPIGAYWIDIIHSQIGAVNGAPVTVQITRGSTPSISIDIDTGIR